MTDWSEANTKIEGKIIFWPNFWHCKYQILQRPKIYSIEYNLFTLTTKDTKILVLTKFLFKLDKVKNLAQRTYG